MCPAAKTRRFPPFVRINSGTLVIARQWRELIKVFWLPRVLVPLLVQNLNLPLGYFRREQWADQIARAQKRDWLQPDAVLFAAEEGRERKLDVGWRSGVYMGEICAFVFFASRTSLWNTCVDQRQCKTCVLTSSKHVPLTLGSPCGVCYPAVCLQVAGPGWVV